MREITPIEKTICLIERFQKELDLMKAELAAHLPDDDRPAKNYFTNPLTGKRKLIKRKPL